MGEPVCECGHVERAHFGSECQGGLCHCPGYSFDHYWGDDD